MRCLRYLSMVFSTYQEQVRPEVWFSQPLVVCGEGLPSEKLHQQVLKSCVQEDVMEGKITEASSSADGVRLAWEELVLQQCYCSSLITQINLSIVSECVLGALFLFFSELSGKSPVNLKNSFLLPSPILVVTVCAHREVNLMFPLSSDSRSY